MKLYGLVGTGGFSREVMPVANEMLSKARRESSFELVFVGKRTEAAASMNGHRIVTDDQFLADDREKFFNVAIADPLTRQRISGEFIAQGAMPFSVTSANSACMSNNDIGEGAILCPFVTITSNAKIGRFFHANLYSYVAHDCRVGDFVTFAPSVHCNGRVIIEDYAYIGTGVVIRQGTDEKPIVIGRKAVVGMGAVVTKSVAPSTTVVGNPARPLKEKHA